MIKTHSSRLRALTFMFLLLPFAFAQGYTIKSTHPRIFVDQAKVNAIAQRCGPGGPYEKSYLGIKNYFQGTALNPANYQFPGMMDGRVQLAFLYLIEKASGRDASSILNHITTNMWKSDASGIGEYFGYDAIAYDWVFNELTPAQRILYGNKLGTFLTWSTGRPEVTLTGGPYWYNQVWSLFMGTSWSRDAIAPKTMVALAIAGDNPTYNAASAQFLQSFETKMPGEFTDKLNLLGGVWPEGPGHGGMLFELFLTWEAWNSATGQNLFSLASTTGFFREAPYWMQYSNVPHTGYMPHMDDVGPANFKIIETRLLRALHAWRFQDPYIQSGVKTALDSNWLSWTDIIWNDPTLAARSVTELPTAYHFAGANHTYVRSGWGSADDTWAMLASGPFFTGWGTWGENGTFQIAKDGILAGNGGYQSYDARLGSQQNIMLVYDPGEKFVCPDGPLPNDGGNQIPEMYHVNTPLTRGVDVAFEHNANYTYLGTDLTRSYSNTSENAGVIQFRNSKKMVSYTRQFVYVRGTPEFFVVYDRVLADSASFPKTWLLHVLNEPEILKGNALAILSNEGTGYKSYSGADGAFCRVDSRDGRNWQTAKRGAMAVRTLLPLNAKVTKRGGVGYEMWGNPHNPTAGNWGRTESGQESDIDLCYWRLEVEPPDLQKYHRFLHVLVPFGDAAGKPRDVLLPRAGDFELVVTPQTDGLRLQLNGKIWEVSFSTTGTMGGQIKISQAGTTVVDAPLTSSTLPNNVPAGSAVGIGFDRGGKNPGAPVLMGAVSPDGVWIVDIQGRTVKRFSGNEPYLSSGSPNQIGWYPRGAAQGVYFLLQSKNGRRTGRPIVFVK